MARLRYNGLTATLGAALTTSATAVTFAAALTHANGVQVPTIASPDYLPLTLLDSNGNLAEIVYLTAYTAGATTGTITRAAEGAGTAVAHNSGDKVVHGPTVTDIQATRTINAQTGTAYTLSLSDAGSSAFLTLSNAAAIALTVPANSAAAFPVGTVIEGAQLGAGQVTLTPATGVTVNASPGLKVAAQYGTFGLLKTATDTWLAYGRLSA